MNQTWTCVRQRAGPLVKECRYQRPTLRKWDLPSVEREKKRILAMAKDSCFRRTATDRCELFLALLGRKSTFYTLTFRDAQLPQNFAGVRKAWRSFLYSLRRWRKAGFDYIYCVEAKHGDGRYHIHMALRDKDFSLEEIMYLWPGGHVDAKPLICPGFDSFRARAEYFTKERTDGIRLPTGKRTWVASRSLYHQMPPQEKFHVDTGEIVIPPDAEDIHTNFCRNPFGVYRYASYTLRPRARDNNLEI